MKFVTLALALLLAVAAQAAPAAVSPLDHARSVVDIGLTRARESLKRALASLEGTEYAEQGKTVSAQLDAAHEKLKAYQETVKPNTDQAFATLTDMTEATVAKIKGEIAVVQEKLAPLEQKLKDVVDKHIVEYKGLLEPIIKKHHERHNEEMDKLKTELEPVMTDLSVMVEKNVEETKEALIPILQVLHAAASQQVTNAHEAIAPVINEYREQVQILVEKVKTMDQAKLDALKEKLQVSGEQVKAAITVLFGDLASALQLL